MTSRRRKLPQPPRMEESPYSMPVSWELFWHHEVGELVFPTSADDWTKSRALCPYHADKTPGTFDVNLRTGCFHCWSCGERGSAARYVRDKYGLSWPDAYKYVKEHG